MKTVPLGDLCTPRQWRALSRKDMLDAGYPVYGANGVIGFSEEFTHTDPVIAVGCRGTIGPVHITHGPAFVTSNAMALDALDTKAVSLPYLAHYLAWRGLADVTSGSSQPQLTRANLVSVQVPLPTLEQQRRIAAILDHADALRAKRRQVLAHLDALPQAIFHQMFGSEHRTARLSEVAATSSGGTPSRSVPENYGGGIPWVKSGELHAGEVTSTEETISQAGLASSSAKLLPAGTVLIAMYGATAGVVGQLGIEAATNQAVCAISAGTNVTPEFLISALRAKSDELLSRRSGGAQPNLSQATIRALELPVPIMTAQEEFSSRMLLVASQRRAAVAATAAVDELFASLQSSAFRGEL